MAIRSSSSSGIPFGNTSGRPSNPSTGQPYFNGEAGRLELYTLSGWQNIVQETPGVASVSGHYYESENSGTFIVSGTNFVSGVLAYAIGTNGTEYAASTTTYNSIVQCTAVFTNLSPAYEPYDIKIVNPSNLFGLLPDAFYINNTPVWNTAAGSLGSVYGNTSVSKSVLATDPESSTITYSISSGALPGGLSLNTSTGAITGTVTNPSSDTTYTFAVSASDGNNSIVRSFNIPVVSVSVLTGGTLSSDSTYYYRTFTSTNTLAVSGKTLTADILTVAGGGGAGGASPWWTSGGGGGAGGVVYSSSQSLTANTYTATIGGGGAGMPSFNGGGAKGENTTFTGGSLSLTAAVGGGKGGAYSQPNGSVQNGGSGGGGGGPDAGGYLGGQGTVGQGNNGGTAGSSYSSSGNGNNGSGGGGGAGAAGSNSSGSQGGPGGSGTNSYSSWITAITSEMSGISGWSSATSTGYIAGGGGGGSSSGGSSGGSGGGGAGAAGSGIVQNGSNATTNTGGGGGGAIASTNSGGSVNGGNGGSGLIIVRYTKTQVGG